ncbi:hypothetical protein DUNSADRAFT_13032 [Dunaliella salina]|uniref:Uncharacterized protein n=1 Tax=Dunaliella salina TaxID=3046 RepID=A0ABQ7GA67_DUNSA|nr:hypothetical protein DUNSADRAFT_13032 [Dunaliella salina]|eukprot:KAF5831501.1 hypothetical protein DUNSADRAFT_13032 [Dunaliella salina]
MLLFLRDIEGTPLRLHVYAMILLAVCLSLLTSDKAPLSAPAASTWARRIAVLFSVMQSVVTAHVAFGVNVNGGKLEMMVCSRWLDMATNMIVAVPCLALADMSVKSWLALACMSIFVSTPFYISVQGYSLPMAVFKAAVVQGLILIAYSCIERPKCAAYARLYSCTSVRMQGEAADANWRAQNKCASLGKKPPPSSSSFIISPELSPSLVGADPEASAHSKQPSPVDSRGKLPPVENMKGRKYRSMLRRTTVSVKLHSNFGPEVVHDGMAKQLSDAMMTA